MTISERAELFAGLLVARLWRWFVVSGCARARECKPYCAIHWQVEPCGDCYRASFEVER